ncbi:hypothetical protein Pan216_16950 [Planctomycetes bacterium Pan216]|uniref:Uncharacterized protein n=1 Tax=Kolteria novifilia TaxID=2527975 RepID=A0A518B1J5_9BACT|nr:hypothetical protein Pan216_16950 [Planctomycetes bacterium Pan216]
MVNSRKFWAVVTLSGITGIAFLGGQLVASDDHPDQEQSLVQRVHEARDAYQASLERLRAYYVQTQDSEAQRWVEQELTAYHMILKTPYILNLDLPSRDLRPDSSIINANQIFRQALDWLNKSSFTEREANYKRAELLLQRLVHDYPRSDKLDEACYYLGQIYSSKYFQQYRRAAAYYERVFHYEPNTNLDARNRAAFLYENYIADRRRAVELYQEVLRREVDPEKTREANKRLSALLNNRTAQRQ